MSLTPEQIASFKEVGYVVIPDLIDSNVLENWPKQIQSQIGDVFHPKTAGDPEKYRKDITVLRNFRFTPEETQCANQPKVKAIIDQLGGGQFQGEDGNIRLIYPEPDREWSLPQNGHIDGYIGKRGLPFLLGLATFTMSNPVAEAPPSGPAATSNPGDFFKNILTTSKTLFGDIPNTST
jgi:hypothetical protein